jgi:homoaconitase/3-isopropylmalate dehydratase large subunit
MYGQTIAEKITPEALDGTGEARKGGRHPFCSVDFLMSHDATPPMAIRAFETWEEQRF